jgi:hypothetical protein
MKIRKKNVYYCDFCKKHSLMPLLKHERACTLNPGRTCRMCEQTRPGLQEEAQKIYDQVIKRMSEMDGDAPYVIEVKVLDFMDPVEGCPACALTILRLVRKLIGERLEDWTIILKTDFDYAKEKTAWWAEVNASRQDHPGEY